MSRQPTPTRASTPRRHTGRQTRRETAAATYPPPAIVAPPAVPAPLPQPEPPPAAAPAMEDGILGGTSEEGATWSLSDRFTYLSIDRAFKAGLGRLTLGLSPAAIAEQNFDWLAHIAISPGKQMQLWEKAVRKSLRFMMYASQCALREHAEPCITPLPQDRRFEGEEWQRFPFNMIHQSFLLTQQWWHNATTAVDGVTKHHEQGISFTVRQILDTMSPSNFPWTNPEIIRVTREKGGRNLVEGFRNLVEDWHNTVAGKPPVGAENFRVGHEVAITPGKVVYQNRLIELIQYSPATAEVHADPVLIVPAWIMKYYILDLSPGNSLVRYLVGRGHTVFMISWKNPTSEDRDLGMDDYRRLGIMSALDTISAIVPKRSIHAAGYCLGGTLLAIAAAAMGRDGDDRLGSLTLLAAQTDFTEAGELTLFINESEISYLENMMWERGYLDTYQMSGAFQILRSNDLVWSRIVHEYLLGGRQPMNDLMAWNADATRMPYRMHSEYLRRLFLNNDFAEGRFEVDGRPITVSDIRVPAFAVGTATDHVAPWRSVYKIHLDGSREVTFVLTSGGHNAGIVSEPGHPRRSYQIRLHRPEELYLDPESWQTETEVKKGSWWPEWQAWLAARSGPMVQPPPMGAPSKTRRALRDAPGTYVRQP
jgi:polyhydroxyalkanoate synthase